MGTDFAPVARLLASPARSAIVGALMGGRPLAAGELARLAGVRASTVSEHLAGLVGGGLLTVIPAAGTATTSRQARRSLARSRRCR